MSNIKETSALRQSRSYDPPDKSHGIGWKPKMDIIEKHLKLEKVQKDPEIESIISMVSEENIRNYISKITSFHTRHSKSSLIHDVAAMLKDKLIEMGNNNVIYHEYHEEGYDLKNVICTLNGYSDNVILVCAHYDSRMENLEDATSRAPGADDNASGMAVLLEIANVISKLHFKNTIQLAFFSGEEQGLWGSKHYAKFIKDNDIPLKKLINLDMVGYHSHEKQICIVERDIGNTHSTNNGLSELLAQKIEESAKTYTDISTVPGPIYSSDYMPFEDLGYVVVGGYDGGAENNPHYHSIHDEMVDIDIAFISKITKIILATILVEAKVQRL